MKSNSPQMMKYTVIINDDYAEFEQTVNSYLQNGWELQGGVSVVYFEKPIRLGSSPTAFRYHQAMCKKD